MSWLTFLKLLDTISPLLVIIFFIINRKKTLKEKFELFVFLFLILQFILNGVANFTKKFGIHNNQPVYHLNYLLSYFIFSLYFLELMPYRKKLIILFAILFYALSLSYLFVYSDIFHFSSTGFGFIAIFLSTLCFIYFYDILKNPVYKKIAQQPRFWFTAAIFTYYMSSFAIFIAYEYLSVSNPSYAGKLWLLHNFMMFIFCVYCIIGVLCQPRQEKSS